MNAEELSGRIADCLSALADVAAASGMHSIEREIREERLPALREGRMSMVVLGEFNHGKSTAINALLETEVLPTGITPTPSVIPHILSGAGPARVVRDSGVQEVAGDALHDIVTTEPPEDLRHVEIRVESEFLAEGLFVVDTPGVNDISKQKVEITYGYVPRADVIVYVLDATQALKRSEINFIENRLIRNSQDRLFFLLGKVDALSQPEVDEILTHVRSKLTDLVGEVPIFPASARRAIESGDEGFEAFRDAIRQYLTEQRAAIVVEGGLRTGRRLGSLIDQSLAIELGALHLETDELTRRVDSVKKKLSRSRMMVSENLALIDERTAEITATAREATQTFVRDFTAALPREIERGATDDLKRYLPDFIHDTFKEWLEAEGTHVALKLELLAEEIIAITNRNMREAMEEVQSELGLRTRDLDLEVDTFGYDVGVFALGALGVTFLAFSNLLVGGLLTIAAPVLAFVMKDKVDAVIRDRAKEQGLAAIRNAGAKVEAEFESVIAEFAEKLKQFVEDSGDRLYRQVAEALDRVVAEREKHADAGETLELELSDVRDRVAETRATLEAIRAEVLADEARPET